MNKYFKLYCPIIEIILCIAIIIGGIILRTKAYFADLPFWVDEEAVIIDGINILKGNEPCYRGLENQYLSPIIFFFGRFIYNLYGLDEMALRLIPFVSSLITLPLFALLTKKVIRTPFLFLLPLLFIAINQELIFNSQYFKFYSTDFLAVIIISLFVFYLEKFDKKKFVYCLIASVILAWSGFNPVFYLTGITICLFFFVIKNSTADNWRKYFIFSISWGSFAGLYVYELLTRRTNLELLTSCWQDFGNFFPKSTEDFSGLFFYHLSFWPEKVSLVCFGLVFFAGLAIMIKKYGFRFVCFISPVFVMLLLAAMGKFPFIQRQTLCLMPIWLICCTKAIDFCDWKSINKYLLLVPSICLCLLISIFSNYDISYVKQIMNNPDYFRMSTGKEIYKFIQKYYKADGHHAIYMLGRDSSLRIYDYENKIIDGNDIYDIDEFNMFISKIEKDKHIHIYIKDYPYIGTSSSENYSYIKENCEIVKEIDDGYGKYVIFKKI